MSRITHDVCDLLNVPHRHQGTSRREEALALRRAPHSGHGQEPSDDSDGIEPSLQRSSPPLPEQDRSRLAGSPTDANRRLILAGGSGFLGGLLARHFIARGWEVMVLTRGKAGQRLQPVRANGNETGSANLPDCRLAARQHVEELEWDGRTIFDWAKALDGAGAVINLAGLSVNCRYHARNRRLLLDSRLDSTRVLGEAIARCVKPPPIWLNSSTATIYRHTFGPAWTEAGEIGGCAEAKDIFSVHIATEWERVFNEANTPRTRKVALRSAMVLGHGRNSVLPSLLRLGRLGLGGSLGDGRQFVSWIHEEDFCRAVEWIIEHDHLSGPVNLAAPNPVTNAEFMAAIRQVCRAPFGMPATRWMLEVGAFFLRTETELLIKSRRVVPGKLLAGGFTFRHPQLPPAIEQLLQTASTTDHQPTKP